MPTLYKIMRERAARGTDGMRKIEKRLQRETGRKVARGEVGKGRKGRKIE
jgi:hypothetical protein